MKWFDNTALTLVIIGAVNWLLIGVFRFDLAPFSSTIRMTLPNFLPKASTR